MRKTVLLEMESEGGISDSGGGWFSRFGNYSGGAHAGSSNKQQHAA